MEKRNKLTKYIIIGVLLVIVITYLTFIGFRLTFKGALNTGINYNYKEDKKVRIVSKEELNNECFVVYEIEDSDIFGTANIKKYMFGLFKNYKGGASYLDEANKHKPFKVVGSIRDNKYYMGVKVYDPKIKYIAFGSNKETYKPKEVYNLNIDYIKDNLDSFTLKKVNDGYVSFVGNEYTKEKYTVRAFNENGNVIADSYYDYGERYIKSREYKKIKMNEYIRGYLDRDGRITLYVSRSYNSNLNEKKHIKDKYIDRINGFSLTNIEILDYTKGLDVKKVKNGVMVNGEIKEYATVSFIIEGLTQLSHSGWNRKYGERIEQKFPIYNKEDSNIPLGELSIRLKLTQMAKNIKRSYIQGYFIDERVIQNKNMHIIDKDTKPTLYFKSSSLKNVMKLNGVIDYYIDERMNEYKNEILKYIIIILLIGLIISNLILWKKIKENLMDN
ncbi:MAG: hypothetical protein FH753_11610 [Firmicutes bacterium]|nr:hypothetical protein [Bacillota bacterium]